jgi:phage shock protein PspC (stress-responsive transcriptional regulator)
MNTQRRLTRSVIDKKIAGVCAGLVRYLGVDVTVLRIIFLISLFFGGLGFWIYLIVWLVAPEE